MEGAQEPLSLKDAIDRIMAIRDEVAQMGANDAEIPLINQIIDEVKNNKDMSPDEAVRQAYEIRERKASYH